MGRSTMGGAPSTPLTKADKSGHAALLARPLTVAQLNAIDQLIGGATDAEAAAAAKVSRQTVNTWRNYQPQFQAELNARRRELWAASADRLRSLVPAALAVLDSELALGTESALRAAVTVLKLAGADRLLDPAAVGPTTAEGVLDEAARQQSGWGAMLSEFSGPPPSDFQREAVVREWATQLAACGTDGDTEDADEAPALPAP